MLMSAFRFENMRAIAKNLVSHLPASGEISSKVQQIYQLQVVYNVTVIGPLYVIAQLPYCVITCACVIASLHDYACACVCACVHACMCIRACVCVCLLMLQPDSEARKIAAKSTFREIIKMTGTVPERVEKPDVLIEMSSDKHDDLIDAITTAGLNPHQVEGLLSGECRQRIMADFSLNDKDFDAVYSWIIDGDPADEAEDKPEDPDDLEVSSAKRLEAMKAFRWTLLCSD